MSAASDYLSQQMTLAASKAPIVTFVSCQRSLAPSAQPHINGRGLATFGWGIDGQVHRDAAGKPDTISRLQTSSSSGVSGRTEGHVWDRVWDWVRGPTVVALKVVLFSWRTGTGVASAPTWTVSTSVVDGPSQQLVFNIPGSFQIPGAESAPHGAAPAVMLVSFNPQGEFGWL